MVGKMSLRWMPVCSGILVFGCLGNERRSTFRSAYSVTRITLGLNSLSGSASWLQFRYMHFNVKRSFIYCSEVSTCVLMEELELLVYFIE